MEDWIDIVGIIRSAVTSIGIIIAGIWAYFLFVRQRLSYPRLNIELFVQDAHLPENTRLVHVQANLKNIGTTIVSPDYAEMRLRKIVPVPDDILPALRKGFDPVPERKSEYEWPAFVTREWKFDSNEFEIEPSEKDSLHVDFIIPNEISVIELYFFIRNQRKKRKKLGWSDTRIFSFNRASQNS